RWRSSTASPTSRKSRGITPTSRSIGTRWTSCSGHTRSAASMRTTSSWPRRSTASSKKPRGPRRPSPAKALGVTPTADCRLSTVDSLRLFPRQNDQHQSDDAGAEESPARVFPEVLLPPLLRRDGRLDLSFHALVTRALARGHEEPRETDDEEDDSETAHSASC